MHHFVIHFLENGLRFRSYINLHNDICPRPIRWRPANQGGAAAQPPMVWGTYAVQNDDDNIAAEVDNFLNTMRQIQMDDDDWGNFTIIRPPTTHMAWDRLAPWLLTAPLNLPLQLGFRHNVLMEYPELALYVEDSGNPDGYSVHRYITSQNQMKRLGYHLLESIHQTLLP